MPWYIYVRDILAILLIVLGLCMFIIEIYGVYRFSFVLNRMHAAAIGDTMGLTCCLFGLMLLTGFSFTTAKFLLVLVFMWISSPASSHLVARFETEANASVLKHCKEIELDKKEEEQ